MADTPTLPTRQWPAEYLATVILTAVREQEAAGRTDIDTLTWLAALLRSVGVP